MTWPRPTTPAIRRASLYVLSPLGYASTIRVDIRIYNSITRSTSLGSSRGLPRKEIERNRTSETMSAAAP